MCTPPRSSQARLWTRPGLFSGFLVLGLVAVGASSAQAQSVEERAGARAVADQGLTAYESGDWARAVDLFRRAESTVHSPIHLLFLARSQVKTNEWLAAKENYLGVLREESPDGVSAALARAQKGAASELKELEARIPLVTVELRGAPERRSAGEKALRVLVDGKQLPGALVGLPQPIDPGLHKWQVLAPGGASEIVSRRVEEGVRLSIPLVVPAETRASSQAANRVAGGSSSPSGEVYQGGSVQDYSAGSGSSGWGWGTFTSLVVGAAGLGASGGFYLHSEAVEARLTDCVGNTCLRTDDNIKNATKSDDALVLSAVGLGVGVLGLGTAGLVYFLSSDEDPTSAAAEPLQFSLGWGTVQISGRF